MNNYLKKSEIELLELIGRFFKERNIDLIRPYLHTNIMFGSAWVRETLYGINKFLVHFNEKFKAQKKAEWEIDYFIHPLKYKRKHFLVLKQNDEPDKTTILSVEFKSDRIYYIYLFPTKSVEFTFIEPSYSFLNAKVIHLNRKMHEFARHLDIKNVIQCIRKGANINARDENGETALTIFSKAEKLDAIKYPLSKCDHPIAAMSKKQLLKMKAMQDKLLSAGYFKEIKWGTKNWEQSYEEYNLSEKILDRFARRLLKTPSKKRIELMNKLVSLGACINDLSLAEAKLARNSLFYAVKNKEPELVKFLILNKADVNVKYPGMVESLLELAISELKAEQPAEESIFISKGKDLEIQKEEIENLKIIIEHLKQYSDDKSNPSPQS